MTSLGHSCPLRDMKHVRIDKENTAYVKRRMKHIHENTGAKVSFNEMVNALIRFHQDVAIVKSGLVTKK